MKNLFLLIAFLGATTFAKTQGNLQFNQVLTFASSLSGNCNLCDIQSTSYTVPTGKVWKIESITHSNWGLANGYIPTFCLYVNNINVYCEDTTTGSSGAYNRLGNAYSGGPIWLKSGDIISYRLSSSWTGTYQVSLSALFSIIEFNIVP